MFIKPTKKKTRKAEISELTGKTIVKVEGICDGSSLVKIETECGKVYSMFHEQDCCEYVRLYDFEYDNDSNEPAYVSSAEESTNHNDDEDIFSYDESFTWTFYKIETTKGEIWMRWLGESNGYYSESVDITCTETEEMNEDDLVEYIGRLRESFSKREHMHSEALIRLQLENEGLKSKINELESKNKVIH